MLQGVESSLCLLFVVVFLEAFVLFLRWVSYIWIGMLVMHLLLTSWSVGSTPWILKEKTRQTKRVTWFQNSLSHFCPTKTFANSIRGPTFTLSQKKRPWFHSLAGGNHLGTCGTNWLANLVGGIFSHFFKGAREKPRIPHSWGPKNGWDFWWVSKISRKKPVTIVGFQHIFLGATRWGK